MLIKEEVVLDLKLGKEEALQEVYQTYYSLFSFCYFLFLRNQEKVNERLPFFFKALYDDIYLLQDETNFETWAVKRIRRDAWDTLKNENRFHGWNDDEITDVIQKEGEPFPGKLPLDDLQRAVATFVWKFHFSISFISNYLMRKTSSVLLALKTAEKVLAKENPGNEKSVLIEDFDVSFPQTIPYAEILKTIEIQEKELPKKKSRGPLKSLIIIIALSVTAITGLSIYETVRKNRLKNNPYGFTSQTKTIYQTEKQTRPSLEKPSDSFMTAYHAFVQERSEEIWRNKKNQLISPASDYLTLTSFALGDQKIQSQLAFDSSSLSSDVEKFLSFQQFDFNADKDSQNPKKNSKLSFQSSLWIDRDIAEGKSNSTFLKWSQTTNTEVFATQFTRNKDIRKWLTYYLSSVDESFSIEVENEAIYYQTFRFRDAWTSAFSSIHYDDFYTSEEEKKQILFMDHPAMEVSFIEQWNSYQVIRLYTEENIPITFFVPLEKNQIDFSSLAEYDITSLSFQEELQKCHFSIPQFSIESLSSLTDYLKKKNITPSLSTLLPEVEEMAIGEQYHSLSMNENGIGEAHKNVNSDVQTADFTFTIDRPFAFMIGEGLYIGTIYTL